MFAPPRRLLAAACFLASGASVSLAETADLKIRFEYDAAPPTVDMVKVDKDVAFCGKEPIPEEELVVSDDGGIKNVVLYVYTGRGGTDGDLVKSEDGDTVHELANKSCRFEPHILVTQVGDTLRITNPDEVAHNANLNFFNNKAQNLTIPAGQLVEVPLEKDEPAPIPVDCNIHPWMKGFVLVLDHPYGAVSDDDGTLTIEGLPAGEELTFRVYHESLKIKELKVKDTGETKKVKRARIEMTLDPGMNDMGTWVVPAG